MLADSQKLNNHDINIFQQIVSTNK